jgi:hypothetical protein
VESTPLNALSRALTVFFVPEVAVSCACEFVRRAVLVNQPAHLFRMTNEVGRKLRRNHEVDFTMGAL